MFDPISTYRIQFNKDFGFKQLSAVIPYLDKLGVKTIYASPIYQAIPGSTHGYDVTDPNRINPEIGTLKELRALSEMLKAREMFWIQDIVPNHMGFHQNNPWLMDVLKKGEKSIYRSYFDIVSCDLEKEPLMVPFLGDDLETAIQNGQLQLLENQHGRHLDYMGSLWPMNEKYPDPKQHTTEELASGQYYRLCSYRETNHTINYRRFFTVNSLICLNMHLENVFADYHRLTGQLLKEGIFQGVRIDHVDGLSDPAGYLDRLRALCGKDTYIVVEKILEAGERLPANWPVQGTTGYDYLGCANQLFTSNTAERDFQRTYHRLAGIQQEVEAQVLEKKKTFLDNYMQGELSNLCRLTAKLLADAAPIANAGLVKELISAVLVELPVYRLYQTGGQPDTDQLALMGSVLAKIKEKGSFDAILPAFEKLLLDKDACDSQGIRYFDRLMQFSGPLMAKGVEDTLMYTFHRFIGNNEVGDSPSNFGIGPELFHKEIALRKHSWPLSMNATATHDTKRSEDSRSRLSALTNLAGLWSGLIEQWRTANHEHKTAGMPDANDEYFIYQTLLASCPEQAPRADNYPERLKAYLEKALRESKRSSDWEDPNKDYEKATMKFVSRLLDQKGSFWSSFAPFLQTVARLGRRISLASLVLKHTLPGVPDTYQGTEFWDLSMVDPDNRRPVDYPSRLQALALDNPLGLAEEIRTDAAGDATKLLLLHSLLQLRKKHAELFAHGSYLPLTVSGTENGQVIAYARHRRQQWLVVVVAIQPQVASDGNKKGSWQGAELLLPAELEGAELAVQNVIDPAGKNAANGIFFRQRISLDKILDGLPFAVYHLTARKKKRGAGILMHVSSLPSRYPIGDLGPSARGFLDFLSSSGMRYWQLLPLNPVSRAQSFSPYSSSSVMAGNILFISPEDLAACKLLSEDDLGSYSKGHQKKVNYLKAAKAKQDLLAKAYRNWLCDPGEISAGELEDFCTAQGQWLKDYSLFVLLGRLHQGKPWYQWPPELSRRDPASLDTISSQYRDELLEIKWQQLVFFRQWASLRQHASRLDISLIGDLPLYCAHDSADVWANPGLFSLDSNGRASAVAGVPPDYFNADGQLWGMPVYNWKAMQKDSFAWWKSRMSKNLELYDMLRLDHFRAFASYWEVPAGSATAKNGSWKKGPGISFFRSLAESLGQMSLVAEDLGEITQDVYQLRDKLDMPGMKVLQFAFGSDIPQSLHVPHNYQHSNCIVYTGTHDNNTTRGWYENDIDQDTRQRIDSYLGIRANAGNISRHLIRLALASTADIAILPMQDLLGAGARDRMNTPATLQGNWSWKVTREALEEKLAEGIFRQLKSYGR